MKIIFLLFYLLICFHFFSQKGSKKKIYSSFTIVNDNLETTRKKLTNHINKAYFNLIKEKEKDSNIVSLSDSLRIKTNELVNYLSRIKIFLIIKTEGLEKNFVVDNDTIIGLEYLHHFDDYITPSELLIGNNIWDLKKGKYTAHEISTKISDYSNFILNTCLKNRDKNLIFLDNYWSSANLYNKPLAGVITQISLIQLNIRLTEQATIHYFYNEMK